MGTNFGDYIIELRGKANLREAAKKIGISHTYLRSLEIGEKTSPSYETILKLSQAYNVHVNEILKRIHPGIDDEYYLIDPLEGSDIETLGKTKAFDKHIRSYIHTLIGDDERDFYHTIKDEVFNRVGEILNNHEVNNPQKSIVFSDKDGFKNDIPEQVANMILDIDNAQFQWDVLQELQDIAHEFHIKWNSAYEAGARQPRPTKLELIIERENITYNDKPLDDPDRQRILDMLKLIFPDRQ